MPNAINDGCMHTIAVRITESFIVELKKKHLISFINYSCAYTVKQMRLKQAVSELKTGGNFTGLCCCSAHPGSQYFCGGKGAVK